MVVTLCTNTVGARKGLELGGRDPAAACNRHDHAHQPIG